MVEIEQDHDGYSLLGNIQMFLWDWIDTGGCTIVIGSTIEKFRLRIMTVFFLLPLLALEGGRL